jgi:hypothetical protein
MPPQSRKTNCWERFWHYIQLLWIFSQGKGNGAFATESIRKKFGSNSVTRFVRRLNPFGTPTIAEFPAQSIINAATVQEDQLLGDVLAKHIRRGSISPDEAVRLWLVMHRAMGAHSPYHGYLQALPASFSTPLYFSEGEMKELAGSPLYHATEVCLDPLPSPCEGYCTSKWWYGRRYSEQAVALDASRDGIAFAVPSVPLVLPASFSTPMHDSEGEVKELAGSPLYHATVPCDVCAVRRMGW